MTVSINTAVAGGGSGEGGSSITTLDELTAIASTGTDSDKLEFLSEVGGAQYNAPVTENVDFTLSAASHGNRLVYCTKGSAQAITFNTGHGFSDGDNGRIMQVGAGPVTISKDGGFAAGDLRLSTGVASATTVNDGDILDWEYKLIAGVERFLITFRSAAGGGGNPTTTAYSDGTGAVAYANPGTGETTLASITIPAGAIGPNGWVEFLYSVERTTGTGNVTVRLRVANATTGTSISNPSAASRITGVAHFVSQNSTTSHRTSGNGPAGMPFGTVATLTDTTDTTGAVTFYLTGQLATGTETMTKYYFKALVHNPDA